MRMGQLRFGVLLGLVAVAGLVRGPGDMSKHVMAPAIATATGQPRERVLGPDRRHQPGIGDHRPARRRRARRGDRRAGRDRRRRGVVRRLRADRRCRRAPQHRGRRAARRGRGLELCRAAAQRRAVPAPGRPAAVDHGHGRHDQPAGRRALHGPDRGVGPVPRRRCRPDGRRLRGAGRRCGDRCGHRGDGRAPAAAPRDLRLGLLPDRGAALPRPRPRARPCGWCSR